jgi:tRNA pseudouridine38-40 synthase
MKRYFFQIQYRGTNYFGWQRQPDAVSVQETIETDLRKLFTEDICIVGCGRTDTGVHASDYYFHVDFPVYDDLDHLQFKLNRMLPNDIAIVRIIEVQQDAHARFDAVSRTYQYFVHQTKHPFIEGLSTYIPQPVHVEKMNQAAKLLIGKMDFTSFSKLHTDVKTNICEVTAAEWTMMKNGQLRFTITANRFLRNMVRAIVGTLLDVGMERIQPTEVQQIIVAKNRQSAGKSAPAHGLFLAKVEYDYIVG